MTTLKDFFKTQKLPADLKLRDGSSLMIERLLREVPSRRLVVKGKWNNTPVVAKLFFDVSRARRHFLREFKGQKLLERAQVLTPTILYAGRVSQSRPFVYVLVFEYIPVSCSSLTETSTSQETFYFLSRIASVLAELHTKGFYQKDLYSKNFLMTSRGVYVIDTADLKKTFGQRALSKKRSLQNVAQLLVLIPPAFQALSRSLYLVYTQARGGTSKDRDFQIIQRYQRYYKRAQEKKFLKKVLRNSTQYHMFSKHSSRIICDRADEEIPEMKKLFSHPDDYISQGECLKEGHRCTVAKVMLHKKEFVIKRYNATRLWTGLRHFLFGFPWIKAWQNAHRLGGYGIATPRPVACIQKRTGLLSWRGYLITEYVPGEVVQLSLPQQEIDQQKRLVLQVKSLFQALHDARISHGDMKATNLLVWNNQLYVIDLDHMNHHYFDFLLNHSLQKDQMRFLKNWSEKQEEGSLYYLIRETLFS